ncbi:type VI secretion system protein TssA [Aureimonas sp. ME7]|uniref:type VI secretion system protein TssA n=1 Tax=Aureimonas sp. ME7 TaxID=2744252 RepID=UPI001FCEEE3E|nr:type VI secretion system protein TssA [Aureimonas sp. ME7]
MPFDIEALAEPISETSPAGSDIRTGERVELYYRLKDARSTARSEERNIDPGEAFRLAPAWSDVRSIALEILQSLSQDVEVLAWFCEAELRLEGFAGLRECFALATRLVDARFDALHSIDGDGIEDKVSPLAGLNGVGGEGTLIQPLRLTSLVPGASFFRHTLWDYQMAQRPGEAERMKQLQDAVGEAGPAAMRAHLDEVTGCLAAFEALSLALDAACGRDAPAASNIRAVLTEARLAILNLSGLRDIEPEPTAGEAPALPAAGGTDGSQARTSAPGPIRTREEAFERLLEVARYFRVAEPQSPMADAIETVVSRGRLDFAKLLAELVEDEHTRRTILIAAGIRPESGGM